MDILLSTSTTSGDVPPGLDARWIWIH